MQKFDTAISFKRSHVKTFEVEFGSMTDSVKHFIVAYGLKQILNDAGSAAETEEEKVQLATNKLKQLYDGIVPTQGGGGDPILTEARKLARAEVENAIKSKGLKIADLDKAKVQALIQGHLDKHKERFVAKAKTIVAARNKEVDTGPVDLGDLA